MSLTLDRGLTTPSGRVHSLRGADRPGPCGVPSSLRQMCSRSRCASMPRQSDRAATARFKPRFMVLSSNRTTPQVDQATHTEAFADFAQLLAAGREESAQQPIPAQLLDLNLPALGATAQPLENPGQLRRDRRLSFAEKPSRVVDQLDITSQREARNHAFTRRIQLATVLNRTEPQRLFQTGRRLRTSNASATGGFQFRGLALSFDMVHSPLDRGVIAGFGSLRDLGGHRIQINVDTDRQQGFFADNRYALEAALEKRSPRLVLFIREPRQRFLQALHEPAQVLQPLARIRNPLRVREPPLNPVLGHRYQLTGHAMHGDNEG